MVWTLRYSETRAKRYRYNVVIDRSPHLRFDPSLFSVLSSISKEKQTSPSLFRQRRLNLIDLSYQYTCYEYSLFCCLFKIIRFCTRSVFTTNGKWNTFQMKLMQTYAAVYTMFYYHGIKWTLNIKPFSRISVSRAQHICAWISCSFCFSIEREEGRAKRGRGKILDWIIYLIMFRSWVTSINDFLSDSFF